MKIETRYLMALALSALALSSISAQPTSAGSFTFVGSLSQFRKLHTATLLSNGKVLVAGGSPFAQASTSELYDPSTLSWTNSGELNTGREFHTATLLPEGRVVVTGGQTASLLLASTEVYDPSSGRWVGAGDLNQTRELHTATLLPNGLVLVAGGFPNIASGEVLDPTTGEWGFTGSMNKPRFEHTDTLLPAFTLTLLPNCKVIAAGGSNTNGPLASAELYDPATGVWTPTGSLQQARGSHTATLLPNGTVLVAGGVGVTLLQSAGTPTDPVLASAEIFNPATGTWTPTGSMGQRRQTHTATLLPSDKVLVAGGISYFDGVFPTSAEVYDPATGKWSPTFPLVSGRRDHIAARLPNGKVLVAGGFNNADTGASTELFDPASVVPVLTLLTQPTELSSGAFQFTFRNTPGLSFTVLSTTDLAVPISHWANRGATEELSPGHYQFTDSTTKNPQQFYGIASP